MAKALLYRTHILCHIMYTSQNDVIFYFQTPRDGLCASPY